MRARDPEPAGLVTRHRKPTDGAGEPDWSRYRLRVPGAPADVSGYLLEMRDVADWALGGTECLAPEEAERARRLEDPRRRELFLVSRVVLRHVLARRLGCAPAVAPVIHDPESGAPLPVGAQTFYSVARTPGFVAIAFARRPVGVDVEALQSPAQAAALLETMHPEDRARLLRVPQCRRTRAVTDVWVRLEAVLKARGVGLTLDPARVPVGRRRRTRLPGGWRVTGVRVGRRTGVRLAAAWYARDRRS